MSYHETISETASSDSRKGSVVANGCYGDKRGTVWKMCRKGEGGEEGRLEEGRGIQMREWPRRRESSVWV